jgi:hypothetical protein
MAFLKRFFSLHPRLTMWFVLAAGFVIMLVIFARSVGFSAGQWIAAIVATVALAGACVWIIWLEDEDQNEQEQTKN